MDGLEPRIGARGAFDLGAQPLIVQGLATFAFREESCLASSSSRAFQSSKFPSSVMLRAKLTRMRSQPVAVKLQISFTFNANHREGHERARTETDGASTA